MASALTIPATFTAIDKITAPMRKMTKAVNGFGSKAERSFAKAERIVRRLTPSFGNLGKEIVGLASIATVAFAFNHATNAVLDFEEGLVGVSKTTGIEGAELKKLSTSIINTSNQLKTIKSSKLLELAEAAGQLGVKGSANIIKFSTTMAKLEKASDIEGEAGAKSIARLLTITKEGVGIVDQFASSLVALGNSSAASEAEILSVSSEIGRATAAYKLTSRDILGISAALKSLDVAPEAAGSAVGKVFRTIELATLSGGKKLQAFAKVMQLTPKQVKETFQKTPRAAFSFFVKGLGKIQEKGGSVAKTLIGLGLSGERVSKGIVPLATNYKLLAAKIKLSNDAFALNDALNQEFAASQKTIKSAINSVVRAFENLFIKTATQGSILEKVQTVLFFIGDNIGTIIGLIATYAAGVLMLTAWKIGLIAVSLWQGINNALTNKSIFALRKNAIALRASAFTTKAVTIAQKGWAFITGLATVVTGGFTTAMTALSAAMMANPIGAIIIGIVILIGVITLIISKYDEWGAALTFLLGPIGLIINIIQSFRRNWDMVKQAFATGGILSGLKAIGIVLFDSLLMPLQQLIELIGKFTGSKLILDASASIQNFRERLGLETGDEEKVTNPKAAETTARTESFTNSLSEQIVSLNINDNTGGSVEVAENNSDIPIMLTPTFN